jgi:prepilin-type processing-associated H-X9-DG protein
LNRGYGTNYSNSWYFSRSTPKFQLVNQELVANTTYFTHGAGGATAVNNKTGMKELANSGGPLKRRLLDSGPVTSSLVPLLGDAAPGDAKDAPLRKTIGFGPTLVNDSATADPWAVSTGGTDTETARVFVAEGDLMCETANDGPAYFRTDSNRVSLIEQGAKLTAQVLCERTGRCDPPVAADNTAATVHTYLQDTRDWYAVHGGGRTASANILMADGSVREFSDSNNDKYLNPGFPVPTNLAETEYGNIGYRGPEVELPPSQMFNGLFLLNLQKTENFEE